MKVYKLIQTAIGVMVVENSRVFLVVATANEYHFYKRRTRSCEYNITIVSEAEVNNKEGHNEQICTQTHWIKNFE